jgi:hypothetical protein
MKKEESLIYEKPTVDDLINYLEDYWGKWIKKYAQNKESENETYVPLWNSRYINTTPTQDIQKPLIISAFRLHNIATALHIVYNNGDQFASITNYCDSNIIKHNKAIKKLCTHALNQQNAHKKISRVNFFIIKPYDIIPLKNSYYPYSDLPLEHFPKKLLEPITSIKTTVFCYHPLDIKTVKISPDQSLDVYFPVFELILYPNKAFILTDNKKIKLFNLEIAHIIFTWWALKMYCAHKIHVLHEVVCHITTLLYKIYES